MTFTRLIGRLASVLLVLALLGIAVGLGTGWLRGQFGVANPQLIYGANAPLVDQQENRFFVPYMIRVYDPVTQLTSGLRMTNPQSFLNRWLSPDGQYLFSLDEPYPLLLDTGTLRVVCPPGALEAGMALFAWTPDNLLFTQRRLDGRGTYAYFDPRTCQYNTLFPGPVIPASQSVLSPDGTTLALYRGSAGIELFNLSDGTSTAIPVALPDTLFPPMYWHAYAAGDDYVIDSRYLLIVEPTQFTLIDLERGTAEQEPADGNYMALTRWSGVPNLILSFPPDLPNNVSAAQPLGLWRVEDGSITRHPLHGRLIYAIDFSPDGRWIAYVERDAQRDPQVYVWDEMTQSARHLALALEEVERVSLSPDGRRLVVTAVDGFSAEHIVLDLDTGAERRFPGLPGQASVWLPDSQRWVASRYVTNPTRTQIVEYNLSTGTERVLLVLPDVAIAERMEWTRGMLHLVTDRGCLYLFAPTGGRQLSCTAVASYHWVP